MRKRIKTEEQPQAAQQTPAEIDWDRYEPEEWLREMFPSFVRDFAPHHHELWEWVCGG